MTTQASRVGHSNEHHTGTSHWDIIRKHHIPKDKQSSSREEQLTKANHTLLGTWYLVLTTYYLLRQIRSKYSSKFMRNHISIEFRRNFRSKICGQFHSAGFKWRGVPVQHEHRWFGELWMLDNRMLEGWMLENRMLVDWMLEVWILDDWMLDVLMFGCWTIGCWTVGRWWTVGCWTIGDNLGCWTVGWWTFGCWMIGCWTF